MLTSTTVIANGVAAAEAGELPRRWPGLSVGVHVNLTLGAPVADPAAVRSLLDADGRFLGAAALRRRLVRGLVSGRHVRREVEAQIARVSGLGVRPTHWDAHQQVPFWSGLIGPAAAAARGAGLRRARSPRVHPVTPGGGAAAAVVRWWLARPVRVATDLHRGLAAARLARRFVIPSRQLSPAVAVGAPDLAAAWAAVLASVPRGVSEIVSHPAVVDDELRALVPGSAEGRATDLAVLCEPAVAAALRRGGVTLIGFGDLPGHR